MSPFFTKFRIAIATVTLVGFGLGCASASGAQVFEQHLALSQTRAAARDVDNKRQGLEESLARAQAVTRDASTVSNDVRVVHATKSLLDAADSATAVARSNDVELDVQPATPPLQTSDAELINVVEDPEVAQVLAGNVGTVDDTREAKDRLVEVADALDAATDQVQNEVASVQSATDRANVALATTTLEEALLEVSPAITTADDVASAVGQRVTDGATLSDMQVRVSALRDAATAADSADHTDLDALKEALGLVTQAVSALGVAVDITTDSHTAWVSAENDRRDNVNAQTTREYKETVSEARSTYTEQNLKFADERANGWTGKPSEVVGSNGRLAASTLCPVSFAPGHSLQCGAAAALDDADEAYFAQTGRHLAMTDSYRSYGLQVTTRARKPSTAARPGTSNHGWGMAIDLDAPSATWLRNNGAEFGWIHPTWASTGGVKPESWHLEYVAPEVGGFVEPNAPDPLEPVASALDND